MGTEEYLHLSSKLYEHNPDFNLSEKANANAPLEHSHLLYVGGLNPAYFMSFRMAVAS